jgi:hypothetical protein
MMSNFSNLKIQNMHFGYKVIFKEKVPTEDQIIKQIKQVTGLDVNVEHTLFNKLRIEHPLFPEYSFKIIIEPNAVALSTGHFHVWYLLEATLAALVSLGGETSFDISELAKEKWETVKHKYEIRKRIDWDGVWPEEEKGPWNS